MFDYRITSIFFLLILIWTLTSWSSPSTALLVGLIFGLAFIHPFRSRAQALSKVLLQACVVMLGFEMNFPEVAQIGASSFVYTALGISLSLLLGLLLGNLLNVNRRSTFLVSVGTAICGGSAIAAVGRLIHASDDEMSVSLGTVFILNAVGLLVFPAVGSLLGLNQTQFGLWAALAIHDTSSVVGAGAKYGAVALRVATTVKLTRAFWIVPVSVAVAAVKRSRSRIQLPWFICCFVLAVIVSSYLPLGHPLYARLAALGRTGLKVTLFLIGSNISRHTLKALGVRSLILGLVLWISIALTSLLLIQRGVIKL